MGTATIISTWIDEPSRVDGWPIVQPPHHVPTPSLWLIDPVHTDHLLAAQYEQLLSDEERTKAARFHQPAHQVRYKTTHTVLRMLLGGASDTKPADLQFIAGHHNKPNLSNKLDRPRAFNLSYTENRSLIGIVNDTAIGVDIEWLHRPLVVDDMLPACFSSNEIDYIKSKQEGVQNRFFTLWTRKEAILKLTGEGIGEHLPLFEVLDGTCIAEKAMIGGNPPDRIYLYTFAIDNAYVASYAVPGPLDKLPTYQL